MSLHVKVAAAAIAVALSVSPAFAELLNFSWTISPGFVATWTQPSNPTPSRFDDGFFTTVQVSDGSSTQGPFQFVDYENSESDGGLEIFELSGAESIGLQFYTDSEAALDILAGQIYDANRICGHHGCRPGGSRTGDLGDDAGVRGPWLCGLLEEGRRPRNLRARPAMPRSAPTRVGAALGEFGVSLFSPVRNYATFAALRHVAPEIGYPSQAEETTG